MKHERNYTSHVSYFVNVANSVNQRQTYYYVASGSSHCFCHYHEILMIVASGSSHCFCHYHEILMIFVCFVALRPKSTAMVIAGWSVHLTTLFPGRA